MRCGTLRQFAEDRGLNEQQVRDYLRLRSGTAHIAVATLLGIDPDHFILSRDVPFRGLDTAIVDGSQHKNAGAK